MSIKLWVFTQCSAVYYVVVGSACEWSGLARKEISAKRDERGGDKGGGGGGLP
jgi:hypothetical protein